MSTARTLTTRIQRPAAEVTAWLARPGIDARLTPPWAQTPDALPPSISEPRAKIYATTIKSADNTSCILTEEIRAPESLEIDPALLERALAYRHATIRDDIEHAATYGYVRRLRIAIAGSTGLIGRALTTYLQTQKHEIIPLARDPDTHTYDPEKIAHTLHAHPADVLINLAGSNIADGKWEQPQRDLIWESRATTTRALVAALSKLKHRPYALLSASATGYYGTRGNDILDENSPPPPTGTGFLSDVCAGWEHEATAANELAIRTTTLRFGMVLTPAGGALATMLPFFEKKLGGKLGHGRQWNSWISIDDCVAAIYHTLLTHTCGGPLNITAPNPVTNAEFSETLGKLLGKPNTRSIPRWLLRLRYGIDFSNETLLASQRVTPAKLQASAYTFRHSTLAEALEHLLP